jgi:beta-lactamase regulating signal transducer with metallopeptidase domain
MENVFLHLLNLSITAGYIILAVILLRLMLFKAPKWINCLLWAVVGLRLAIPFSIESIFSLIPSAEPIPADIMVSPMPQIHTGIGAINRVVNPIIQHSFTPAHGTSSNPLQHWVLTAAIIWGIGLCAILLYGTVSYFRLKSRVSASINLHDNVYCCDNISSPFILGIFCPRIYIPSAMSEEEARLVIAHENAHLARKDHIFKPLGFLFLAVYWFSPLVWVAYILFCRDVEKACDERVISNMDTDGRKKYSEALLNCSIRRFTLGACPLAFGEVGVKSRIKAILNIKSPLFGS